MVRIITGYSNTGGSTVALINLTNQLNNAGYETVFYGPHDWHLGKCKSEQYTPNTKMKLNKEDTVIFHFKTLSQRPPVKKVILACHEKWWFQIGKIPQYWDTAVFLHEEHYKYHKENGYNGNYCIIPNFKESFTKIDKIHLDKVAGIIGSIEDRKKTHLSIQRALADGCEKVYLFGKITDENYFNFFVKPFLNDRVVYKGFCDIKQEVYNQIGRVYHSSIGEVASLVKDECYSTGTLFFGNDETNNQINTLSNKEILDLWVKEVEPEKMLKLNFGAGSNHLDGWENHDIDVDITKPLPYQNNTVSFIMNEHVLEHVTQQQGVIFLKECFRILKPGGVLRIATPSISRILKLEDESYRKFVNVNGWGDGNKYCGVNSIIFNFGHVCVWSEDLLRDVLIFIGFKPELVNVWESKYFELQKIERHCFVIGHHFNNIETMCFEAVKPY